MESIDYEKLRQKMMNDLEGAYFGTGFGAALMEREDIANASLEELVQIAIDKGLLIEEDVDEKEERKRR